MDNGVVDHTGEVSVFGQVWRALKQDKFKSFKKNNPDSRCWKVSFLGEASIDAGGPY